MSYPGSRLEVAKIAHVLGSDPSEFSFLAEVPAAVIRELRHELLAATYRRHEARFERLAGVSKMVPPSVTAAIAQKALGPQIAARVAGVLPVEDAVKIARHLEPEFIADMAPHLDPRRIGPLVAQLADDFIVDVGRLLLRRREWVTAARLVPVVALEPLTELVGLIGGAEMLQIALYADEPADLERVIDLLPDERLGSLVQAMAISAHLDEAVMLVESLSTTSVARILAQVALQEPPVRNLFVDTVHRIRAWEAAIPGMSQLPAETLPALANVQATLDPHVMSIVIEAARTLDRGPWLVLLLISLDDAHVEALTQVPALQDPEMVAWIVDSVGASQRIVSAVLRDLGAAIA
jgi:hypothetical protein